MAVAPASPDGLRIAGDAGMDDIVAIRFKHQRPVVFGGPFCVCDGGARSKGHARAARGGRGTRSGGTRGIMRLCRLHAGGHAQRRGRVRRFDLPLGWTVGGPAAVTQCIIAAKAVPCILILPPFPANAGIPLLPLLQLYPGSGISDFVGKAPGTSPAAFPRRMCQKQITGTPSGPAG